MLCGQQHRRQNRNDNFQSLYLQSNPDGFAERKDKAPLRSQDFFPYYKNNPKQPKLPHQTKKQFNEIPQPAKTFELMSSKAK